MPHRFEQPRRVGCLERLVDADEEAGRRDERFLRAELYALQLSWNSPELSEREDHGFDAAVGSFGDGGGSIDGTEIQDEDRFRDHPRFAARVLAVFTEFQGELGKHSELEQKVIDMGAGLERFAWITMGTPTAYDCCFGPITNQLIQKVGIDADSGLLTKYFTAIAKNIENYDDIFVARKHAIKDVGLTDEQVNRIISPLEGIYLIADHIRTLIFAISDGALPSNVGGGYNLRMVLRRIIGTMDRLGLKLDMNEMIDMQIDYLKETYPELEETREEVKTIVALESERYVNSKSRMKKMISKIKEPTVDDLIRLYESDGVTPDYLKEMNVISEIPSAFYSKLSELHQSAKREEHAELPLQGLAETELLYYGDDPKEFDGKVLKAFDKFVVLDKTSFYARGGGQEPDHGTIAGFNVVDVSKHGNIVVHELQGGVPKMGRPFHVLLTLKEEMELQNTILVLIF